MVFHNSDPCHPPALPHHGVQCIACVCICIVVCVQGVLLGVRVALGTWVVWLLNPYLTLLFLLLFYIIACLCTHIRFVVYNYGKHIITSVHVH